MLIFACAFAYVHSLCFFLSSYLPPLPIFLTFFFRPFSLSSFTFLLSLFYLSSSRLSYTFTPSSSSSFPTGDLSFTSLSFAFLSISRLKSFLTLPHLYSFLLLLYRLTLCLFAPLFSSRLLFSPFSFLPISLLTPSRPLTFILLYLNH